MVYVLWGVDAIFGNGYGTQGQSYVALHQRSETSVVFHFRNLLLGIKCFMLITLKGNASGQMVSKSGFKSSGPRSFPGRVEYEFAPDSWC